MNIAFPPALSRSSPQGSEFSVAAPRRSSPGSEGCSAMAPPILPAPSMALKTKFLVLDLNGVLVQCVHCPRVPTVPFCKPEDAKYDGPPAYIKSKLVHLRPWLRRFLQMVQRRWWVVVWSSMTPDNTNAVVEFIFKGIEPPCLVLAQNACKILYTHENKVVKKPNNPSVPQYLKVMRLALWDQRPSLIGVPYDVRPTRENTLMVDDSAAKNVLNPTANFIVCPSWTIEKVQDSFLLDLAQYLLNLTSSSLDVNYYVRRNPIGERRLEPQDFLYNELIKHAKFNKLI